MTRSLFLVVLISVASSFSVAAQKENSPTGVFESIAAELKTFKPDTSAVPDDKITRKILQLRAIKGGFNIDEAIAFKTGEEKAKGEKSKEETQQLSDYFTTGQGHQLLTNAVTRIYREEFTYGELKKLVKFYKTSAGQKLSQRFPVVMLKSLAAAEIIKGYLAK
ncbi:MAG: DUF2059 domain-containing protein [Ferruginibacter sp.]|nr:DUF2059 domain-containing protein [Chitinophagaceae bacterium]